MTSTIDIVGNVTEDVTLRITQSGKQVVNVSVAVNHRKKDAQGNWVDDGTDFYRVELWGAEANNASQSIRKGDRVIVVGGSLRIQHWESNGKSGTTNVIQFAEIGLSTKFATMQAQKTQAQPQYQQQAPQQGYQQQAPAQPQYQQQPAVSAGTSRSAGRDGGLLLGVPSYEVGDTRLIGVTFRASCDGTGCCREPAMGQGLMPLPHSA